MFLLDGMRSFTQITDVRSSTIGLGQALETHCKSELNFSLKSLTIITEQHPLCQTAYISLRQDPMGGSSAGQWHRAADQGQPPQSTQVSNCNVQKSKEEWSKASMDEQGV